MAVGSIGLRASSTVNGTPLRTLGTFVAGADRGRSARRAPRDRASEQRRTKADPQTRRSGESAYGTYSASEDGQEAIRGRPLHWIRILLAFLSVSTRGTSGDLPIDSRSYSHSIPMRPYGHHQTPLHAHGRYHPHVSVKDTFPVRPAISHSHVSSRRSKTIKGTATKFGTMKLECFARVCCKSQVSTSIRSTSTGDRNRRFFCARI